jgi:hypothetical protein
MCRFFLACKAPLIIPFAQAQLDLSSVSVTTLMNGLSLLRPTVSSTEVLIRVAAGTHRLLPYALEFWVEHCLSYAFTVGSSAIQVFLLHRLANLHDKHDYLTQIAQPNDYHPILSLGLSQIEPDERINLYAHLPVQTLMREVLRSRQSISRQNCKNGHGRLHSILKFDY